MQLAVTNLVASLGACLASLGRACAYMHRFEIVESKVGVQICWGGLSSEQPACGRLQASSHADALHSARSEVVGHRQRSGLTPSIYHVAAKLVYRFRDGRHFSFLDY